MSSADVSPDFGTNHADTIETELLSVALIGPDEERRSAVAKALDETRRAVFESSIPIHRKLDHLQRLQASFDVIMLDLDSDPDVALEIVERRAPATRRRSWSIQRRPIRNLRSA